MVTEQRCPRVLLYRAPWRNGEPYFRVQQVARILQSRGLSVAVVAGPRGWSSVLRLLSWPWHVIRAQIVFLYPQPLMPCLALMARALGRAVVIDHYVSYVHMGDVAPGWGRFLRWLERLAYARAHAVLGHTRTVARELAQAYGIAAHKVHAVYSIVDTAHFAPAYAQQSGSLRQSLGLQDTHVVLYHGLWHAWHGLDVLRAAVSRLAESAEPVTLVLMGRPGVGQAHERLLGEVPYGDLPPYLQMADVWCSGFAQLPRGDRSFSSTMIQAMAMARPVITAHSPEKDRYLVDGESVLFVPEGDPDALAEAIRRCLRNPELASRLGQGAREVVEREFSMRSLDEALEAILETWRTPRVRAMVR